MFMLLHRYTVFVIPFANGIPFYNCGVVLTIYFLVSMLCNVLVVDINHNLYSLGTAVSI